MAKKDGKRHALLRLLYDCRKQWIWVLLMILAGTAAGLIQTTISRLYGNMVDFGMAKLMPEMLRLVLPIALLLVLDFVRVAFTNIFSAMGTERAFIGIRSRAFKTLMNARMDALDKRLRSGDMVTRLNGDLYDLCEGFAARFAWFTRVILMAVIALVNCILLSWQLSIIYIILVPILIFVTRRISAPIEKQRWERSSRIGKAMNVASDMLHGLMVAKAFNLEAELSKRFAKQSDDAVAVAMESEKVGIKLQATRYISGLLPIVATMALGLFLITRGGVTVGTIVAFIAISAHIRNALDLMGNMANAVRTAKAQAERIYEVLDLPQEPSGASFARNDAAPVVEMANLDFAYPEGPSILKALTLSVKPGEKVGLVGPSGCGKSSILRLISRLYSRENGVFSMFGRAVDEWSPDELRKGLSMVTQDPMLFDGTIYENVQMGRENATREEVLAAIDAAYLSNFINGLPDGVDTQVGESGSRLSGGQKQRVAIARAMLRDAPLVLLDEATSALDTATEVEVQHALDRLLEGRAAIIVAHRLSTLRNVDRILFIENGEVAEQGTRDELMALRGRYFQMAAAQAEGGAAHGG